MYKAVFALAAVLALLALPDQCVAQDPLKIGVVGPKTGVQAAPAAVTHFPNFKLWAHEVNERGGIKLKGGPRKIELIEYDDRTQAPEAIKAVERLITVDKVDFVTSPFGTGAGLATAPIFDRYGLPQLATTLISSQVEDLIKRYPNLFFFLGDSRSFADDTATLISKLKNEGKIGNKLAMVSVADAFGIEMANIGRTSFKGNGFDIVYDRSYPLGTQDLLPVVKGAQATNPDAFVAWSYPSDTFALAEQAKIAGFSAKVMYMAVATASPSFLGRFGSSSHAVMGMGGVPDTLAIRNYLKRHKEITGVEADFNASAVTYAMLQVLEQTIEAIGSTDSKAIAAHLKANTFQTVIGEVDLRKQQVTKVFTVGQWQDGFFQAVAGRTVPDVKQVILKSGW